MHRDLAAIRIGASEYLPHNVKPGCAVASLGYVAYMDWQQMTSILIVVGTVTLLAWRQLRTSKSTAQSGCGCGDACGKLRKTYPSTPRTPQQNDHSLNSVKKF